MRSGNDDAPLDSGASAISEETEAVRAFYDSILEYEWGRLDHYILEYATTRHYLQRFLPPPPARILDVGGGPGRYALLLAQQGYDVTLVDLSPRNTVWANERFLQAGVERSARALIGDARDLGAYNTGQFDAVLLFGPLYHLTRASDRARAVSELRRVLRTGGMAFTMSLTRAAAIYEGFNRWPEGVLDQDGVERLLATGAGFNFERNPHDFEGVYFSSVDEVSPLHESAGLRQQALVGCEAMLGGRREALERMTPNIQADWVKLVLRVCEDPSTLGASERLLYVGEAS
jgi:SAM-dependent methyltransferase